MLTHPASFQVRRIAPDAADRPHALHLALEAPAAVPGGPVDPRVASLLADAERRCLRTDLLCGVYNRGLLRSAALAVESPGRAALVFLPDPQAAGISIEAAAAALSSLQAEAWARSNLLLQLLLPRGAVGQAQAAAAAGFRRLTRLLYLRRASTAPPPSFSNRRRLQWLSYSAATHSIFLEAMRRTYAQSMDCPELTTIRPVEDALASHKAAGDFDPHLWSVVLHENRPAAVLLLSPIGEHSAFEIVYMGVAQVMRGTGVAHSLMARAVGLAGQVSAKRLAPGFDLALAVDERNVPARRLYSRWGFESVGLRDAWIATFPLTST